MKKYIGSYDGIRVIALMGVVFYHLIPSTFQGGYLGVVTFFVMAGYLTINQIMKVEKKDNRGKLVVGKIKGKITKLYPPLIFMIFLVGVFVFFFFKADLAAIASDIKASLLSVYNYAQIFTGSSYFENTGKLAPFNHIWALSLEIQVYILMFIFLYGKYKPSRKKSWFGVFFLLSIASYAFSTYLIYRGADLSRVYYGTETRLYSFLIGGMAALVSEKKRPIFSKSFNGPLIFIFLLASMASFFVFDANEFTFKYILPAYSLLIALLMVMLRHSDGYQANLLSASPFSLLAKRSYHIYLWHLPIIAIQEKMMAHTVISNASFYLIFFAICLIISEISYRISNGIFKLNLKPNRALGVILALSLVFFSIPYKSISKNSQEQQKLEEMKNTILENEKIQKEKAEDKSLNEDKEKAKEDQKNDKENKTSRDTEEKEFSQGYYNALEAIEWVNNLGDDSLYLDPDLYTKYRHIKGVLIGDSLASMSYHTLFTYMPDFEFDSDHSREMKGALEAYKPYMDESSGDYIVLSLGTNGDVHHKDIDKVRDANEGKSIILNTIVLPYKNQEEERNASIRSYASLHDNVYLSDWYAATKDKPELFFDDKIHTGERGARIMSQLIIKKIIEIESSN